MNYGIYFSDELQKQAASLSKDLLNAIKLAPYTKRMKNLDRIVVNVPSINGKQLGMSYWSKPYLLPDPLLAISPRDMWQRINAIPGGGQAFGRSAFGLINSKTHGLYFPGLLSSYDSNISLQANKALKGMM